MTELDGTVLQRLLEAGRALVTHLDLERVLAELLEIAAEVTDAKYAAIGVLDEERAELERFVTRGVDSETHRAIGDLPRGRGVLGVLIAEPRPLRLSDVGRHDRSYGFPAHHPEMKTFLGVPIVIRGTIWGNLYLTEKADGEEFSAEDEAAVVALSDWAAVAIDNARLYQAAEGRREDLERVVRRLEATTAVARAVGTETDLQRVLELIVKRARALVEARSLILLLADHGELSVAATAGQVDSRALGVHVPVATTVAGEVLTTARLERIGDVPSRFGLDDERLGIVGAETALFVPLVYRGTPLGVLAAFDRLGHEPGFGDDEESLLVAFAASAATAVATAQSVERMRLQHSIHAAEHERRRWARELHDETLQGLAALRVLLTTGLRQGNPEGLQSAVRDAVEQIGEEIASLRQLITELRPAALDQLGLAPAIESLLRRAEEMRGLRTELRLDLGPDRMDPGVETTVYRLIQEGLTNVMKHAGAEVVRVRVDRRNGAVELEVSDDGRGFDPGQPSTGFGLAGMRERAELAGGRLDVDSSTAGTTVRASLPLL